MNTKTLKIATLGLMAALAYISFTFLQVKIATPGGFTSFHLGNTFCVLAALLLGGVPGGIAGAIGMGIGDVLDPIYITYAPKTIILKFGIGVLTGLVAHKIFHINAKKDKRAILIATIASATVGMAFNIVCEPIFSFFYNRYILGVNVEAASILANWNLITTGTNALATILCTTILYIAIRPRLEKSAILQKLIPTHR